MVTDEIQELLEGTMRDDRMAELLHTLSVSPEKRRAFREYLTLNKEIKEDRYASVLTLGEDAAIWESLAAAGAVGTTVATTAGRSIGIWVGRAAALLAVGVVGYILGSQTTTTTTVVRPESGAPVADRNARPGTISSTTAAPATTSVGTNAPMNSGTPADGARLSSQKAVSLGSTAVRQLRAPKGSSAGHMASTGPDGGIESAREMFNSIGRSSSWSPDQWLTPAVAEQKPVENPADKMTTSPAATPTIDTSKSDPAAALMRKMPEGIAFEGIEPATPTSTLFRNGFEATFSEHNGFLPQVPKATGNPDRAFAYRTLDLSYRLNGGTIGFGARIGYGTFSHVTLEAEPVTVSNFNGLAANMQKFVSTVQATRQVIAEAFVNYRHPLSERFALALEASIGKSQSHQQGTVDLSVIGFLTKDIGIQLGAGAGTYWYSMEAEQAEAMSSAPSDAGIDADVRQKYQGYLLLARYGIFYRF